MKALILAGGFGTRLRPLTYTRPKHLLPIANRPHIEHVLDLLQRHGVDEIVLLTSYLAEQFEATIAGASARGVTVHVTHEEEPLGTAGALKYAETFVSDETFLVFNGDVLMDVDLERMIGFHRERGADATIVLTPVEDPSAFGVVPTDDDGRVEGFIEKPAPGEAPTNLINAGIYILEPKVLDRIPAGEVWSAERQLFPDLVSSGAPFFATGSDGYWMDIGTPEKYLQANLDALSGSYPDPARPQVSPEGVLLGEGATVAEGARVSSACLGAGATVHDGAEVTDSVLLPGAVVERGASVANCILGEGAIVGAKASLTGVTLQDEARSEDLT